MTKITLYGLSILYQLRDGEAFGVRRLMLTPGPNGKLVAAMDYTKAKVTIGVLRRAGLIEPAIGFGWKASDSGMLLLRERGLVEIIDTKALLTELRGSHGKT